MIYFWHLPNKSIFYLFIYLFISLEENKGKTNHIKIEFFPSHFSSILLGSALLFGIILRTQFAPRKWFIILLKQRNKKNEAV